MYTRIYFESIDLIILLILVPKLMHLPQNPNAWVKKSQVIQEQLLSKSIPDLNIAAVLKLTHKQFIDTKLKIPRERRAN